MKELKMDITSSSDSSDNSSENSSSPPSTPPSHSRTVIPDTPERSFDRPTIIRYSLPQTKPKPVDFGDEKSNKVTVKGNTAQVLFYEQKSAIKPYDDNLNGKVLFISKKSLDNQNSITLQFNQGLPARCPVHYSVYIWINDQPFVLSQDFYIAIYEQRSKMNDNCTNFRLCRPINLASSNVEKTQYMYVYEFGELIGLAQGKKYSDENREIYFTGKIGSMEGYTVGFRNGSYCIPNKFRLDEVELVHANDLEQVESVSMSNNTQTLWSEAQAKSLTDQTVISEDSGFSFD